MDRHSPTSMKGQGKVLSLPSTEIILQNATPQFRRQNYTILEEHRVLHHKQDSFATMPLALAACQHLKYARSHGSPCVAAVIPPPRHRSVASLICSSSIANHIMTTSSFPFQFVSLSQHALLL
ncbi:hypothetical protein KIN20_003768 [Parelaphostrongylus tenuis]|uniref:Uncharacterized protein n=1 Tax=Parelaphostrongylus tenuis TaxID=148309 RepID=A0AAD5MIS6_PARTN|nr:hypothetical protein KIN20_003768 [Parelaphostrongylus tenuis]